jgi:predicted Rossmann-fold nucleotide-binding protein
MGRDYWAPFLAMIRTMVEAGTIAAADLDLMLVTDSAPDAMAHLEKYAVEHFGLKRRKVPHARKLFGEHPLR